MLQKMFCLPGILTGMSIIGVQSTVDYLFKAHSHLLILIKTIKTSFRVQDYCYGPGVKLVIYWSYDKHYSLLASLEPRLLHSNKLKNHTFLGGMLFLCRVMSHGQPDHPAKPQKCGWRY